MTIRKVWATRVNGASAETFVGKRGTIFFNELTGTLRISDGATVGGQPLALVADDFNFTFGDFVASTPVNGHATLSSTHTNQTIDIKSNGTGEINLTGQFNVFDAQGAFGDEPIFKVKSDGQIRMLVPLADSTTGALEIVGNTSGIGFPPAQTGVILHVTGNSGLVSRNYFDANANYVIVAGRRYNGTQLNARRVLNNETILRIVSQAAVAATSGGDATFGTFGPARISFYANEDQTPTAQGGRIAFEVTKNGFAADGVGTNTITAAYIDAQDGITAIKFNGPLTGNVTGNITGTAPAGSLTGTTLASNIVTSSLTSVGTLGSLTVTNTVSAGFLSGKLIRPVRDAGTIAAGGTLTIDFTADSIVHCVWSDGMTLAYQNFTAGRIVKIMAKKSTGTGTDTLHLDGVTGGQTSTGGTTISAAADATVFIECISTTGTLAGLYIKL